MIAIMKLSTMQRKIADYVIKEIGASGGTSISENPPGIEFQSMEDMNKFLTFIIWDYNTHTIFDAFLRGRLAKRKYEDVTLEVTGIVEACKSLRKKTKGL